MFIDDIKNRYTYLNTMKNVVHEDSRDYIPHPDRTIFIHSDLEPVLDLLMKERPTWRFKSEQRFYAGVGPFYTTIFTIFDGDEALGTLRTENHWHSGATRYYFDNFRLEQARQRSKANYTTKPNVAAKRIIKAFHLKTPQERAVEAHSQLRTMAQEIYNSADWPLRSARNKISGDLFMYAALNWETIQPHLPKAVGIDLTTLTKTLEAYIELNNAVSAHTGRTVRLEANDTYLISHPAQEGYIAETFTNATIPDDIRGALGLLKLVEDKTYIPDVGLRVSANLYFVIDKKGGD
jgi:hypothetical protein